MSYTYDPTTDRGRVRLLVRDTDEKSYVFSDAEIDVFLALAESDVFLAAAMACRNLTGRGVKEFTGVSLGGYRLDASTADGWSKLADVYEQMACNKARGDSVDIADLDSAYWC